MYNWLLLILIPAVILFLVSVVSYYRYTKDKIIKRVPFWVWLMLALSIILFYVGLTSYLVAEFSIIKCNRIIVHDPDWQSKIVEA